MRPCHGNDCASWHSSLVQWRERRDSVLAPSCHVSWSGAPTGGHERKVAVSAIRVRSLPALPAAQHRGRDWEPSQGSHHDVGRGSWGRNRDACTRTPRPGCARSHCSARAGSRAQGCRSESTPRIRRARRLGARHRRSRSRPGIPANALAVSCTAASLLAGNAVHHRATRRRVTDRGCGLRLHPLVLSVRREKKLLGPCPSFPRSAS
jgi:hypothetical protein